MNTSKQFFLYRYKKADQDRGVLGFMHDSDFTICVFTMENLAKIIPAGEYNVVFTRSSKFSMKKPYSQLMDGKVPILQDVKGRSGIRIHCGNFWNDVQGCIAIGNQPCSSYVIQSQDCYRRFMYYMVKERVESFTLKIYDLPKYEI